jgi:hypothetical protein
MRKCCRVLMLVLPLLVWAFPAAAAPPSMESFDVGGAFTLSGVCPFDIYEEPSGNKERLATFRNQAGEVTVQIITGVNKWRLTNLSTGKALDVNASGPARLSVQPETDVLHVESGGVSFFFIQNPPPGIPTYAVTRGRLVYELDLSTFVVTNLFSQQGTVQDICAMLQ